MNNTKTNAPRAKRTEGSQQRVVRRYRIHLYPACNSLRHVTVRWQEKHVTDPSNGWHYTHADGWRNRQRTMLVEALHDRYAQQPPNVAG